MLIIQMEPQPQNEDAKLMMYKNFEKLPQNSLILEITAQQKHIRLSSIISQTVPFLISLSTSRIMEHPTVRVPTDLFIILDLSSAIVNRCFTEFKNVILSLFKGVTDEDRIRFVTNQPSDSGLVGVRDLEMVITMVKEAKRYNDSQAMTNTLIKLVDSFDKKRKSAVFIFSHWFNKQNLQNFKKQSEKLFEEHNLSLYLMDTVLYADIIRNIHSYHFKAWNSFTINTYRKAEECLQEGVKSKVGNAPILIYLVPRNRQYNINFKFHSDKVKKEKDLWVIEDSLKMENKYIGQIELLPANTKVLDYNRNTVFLDAFAEILDSNKDITKHCAKLQLIFYNQDEEFGDIASEVSAKTVSEYLQSKAIQTIAEAKNFIGQKKYEKAMICLQRMIVEIENSKQLNDPNLSYKLSKLYEMKNNTTQFANKDRGRKIS